MKFACCFFAAILTISLLTAQTDIPKRAPGFSHLALHVRDLQKSAEFYEKVMGLKHIPDPFKDSRHIWFQMGPHDQLHVIGGASGVSAQDIEVHFSLQVASLSDFIAHLDALHVKHRNFKQDGLMTVRPDGVKQVYLQDPDGYWIEVNDDKT